MATQFPRPDTPDEPERVGLFPAPDHNGVTYSLFGVAGLLGQRQRNARWLTAYIDRLTLDEGFPRPLPLLKADKLVRTASVNSRWPAAAVHAWLDGMVPPALANGVEAAARAAASNRLDARAGALGDHLRLVGGTDA